jgi:2-polyprenyl-3-methyl-5-hydroxy-6-metoxy-1,4-benzoquinol methylase
MNVPALPSDYYANIRAVEEQHWWHRGMRLISAALLDRRLHQGELRLLDAGCGTGGFLRWALAQWPVEHAGGVDASEIAIGLAREQVPTAELSVAPLHALPFDAASFDVVVANDVLQHVEKTRVEESVTELRRVLAPGGTLLVRTNGARRAKEERADWRVYDAESLTAMLEQGGLRCERVTYANALPSLWAAARGRSPHAPTAASHGIPAIPSRPLQLIGAALLSAEARYLRHPGHTLPYGHTLLALATRND